jgi:hypothetical protein
VRARERTRNRTDNPLQPLDEESLIADDAETLWGKKSKVSGTCERGSLARTNLIDLRSEVIDDWSVDVDVLISIIGSLGKMKKDDGPLIPLSEMAGSSTR